MSSDLASIAFKHITGDYHWGRYMNINVIINVKTRYINATHLCGLAMDTDGKPKQLAEWLKEDIAEGLIEVAAKELRVRTEDLFNVVSDGQPTAIRGTYAHPDLIPCMASWAHPGFAVRMGRIVNQQLM